MLGKQSFSKNRASLKLQVQDAFGFFLKDIDDTCQPGFITSLDQILRTRVRTTGIVHEKFTVFATNLEIYDVGGQRNERRKWIKAFDNVTCVIFFAAISECNQFLFEAAEVDRQTGSIELFHEQLDSTTFQATPFIVFLNNAFIDLKR